MIFGNLPLYEEETDEVVSILFHLLRDKSNFVKVWVISSLALLGEKHEAKRRRIATKIKTENHEDSAVRSRARKVLKILENQK